MRRNFSEQEYDLRASTLAIKLNGWTSGWINKHKNLLSSYKSISYRILMVHLKGETSNYLFDELLRWERVLKGSHIRARRLRSSRTNYE